MITVLVFGILSPRNLKSVNVTSSRRESSIFMLINSEFFRASFLSEFETLFSHVQISTDHWFCKLLLIAGIMSASPLIITIFPLTMQPEVSAVISETICWSSCFSFPVRVLLRVRTTSQPRFLIFCHTESSGGGSDPYRVPQATFLLLATTSVIFPMSIRSLGSSTLFKFNLLAASFFASIHTLESSTKIKTCSLSLHKDLTGFRSSEQDEHFIMFSRCIWAAKHRQQVMCFSSHCQILWYVVRSWLHLQQFPIPRQSNGERDIILMNFAHNIDIKCYFQERCDTIFSTKLRHD